mmetsp:Transcript_8537/g.35600  ORF Transcript_8537/g.35600 Transcript_8537/m.35600 type:complete len:384 (-) Transcript_8537:64-1215(-)
MEGVWTETKVYLEQEVSEGWTLGSLLLHLYSWSCLLYVIYRQIRVENRVTFAADDDKHREHMQRLKTGVFYVPFLCISTMVPIVVKLFISVLIFQGVGECIQIVIPRRVSSAQRGEGGGSEKVHINTEDYHFTWFDRFVQTVSLLPPVGFFFTHFTAAALLSQSFTIIAVVYLANLVWETNGNSISGSGGNLEADGRRRAVQRSDLENLAFYWFAILWVSWPLAHVMILTDVTVNGVPYGFTILGIALVSSWTGDICAYYFGKKFGSTKAMPAISPNKSVEGCIATVVGAIVLNIGLKAAQASGWDFLPPFSWFDYLVVGIIVAVFGIFGDMLESLVKRIGGVKDSGIFFTGHGGILDRTDTFLLICAPLFYYLVIFCCDGFE